jgi:hypothetical protein
MEGWADLNVEGTASGHSYRVHERYVLPPGYNEFRWGYAYTVLKRSDGATLEGNAVAGYTPELLGFEIRWIGTPTCSL